MRDDSGQRKLVAINVAAARMPKFRRCGLDFTKNVMRVDPARLTTAQVGYLLASSPSELVVEPVYEAIPSPAVAEKHDAPKGHGKK